MSYKVKQEDLIGELEGFPIEVAQALINEQVAQGNKANIAVFQRNICSSYWKGGFVWDKTKDKDEFWDSVIGDKNFATFFEKYPARNTKVYYIGDKKRCREIEQALKNLGGINKYAKEFTYNYIAYFVGKDDIIDSVLVNSSSFWILQQGFNQAFLPEMVELTKQEIADKFGIDVKRLKIKEQ